MYINQSVMSQVYLDMTCIKINFFDLISVSVNSEKSFLSDIQKWVIPYTTDNKLISFKK